MKKVIFLGLLCSISSSHALTMHNAEIIEHRTWLSGSNENGLVISGSLQDSADFSSANASARAYNASGTVNSNIYTHGSHGVRIYNTSERDQLYTITIKLCAESKYCFTDQTHVRLGKDGVYSNSTNSTLTIAFPSIGNYSLVGTTTVSGDTYNNSSDRATIYVSK